MEAIYSRGSLAPLSETALGLIARTNEYEPDNQEALTRIVRLKYQRGRARSRSSASLPSYQVKDRKTGRTFKVDDTEYEIIRFESTIYPESEFAICLDDLTRNLSQIPIYRIIGGDE